MTEQEPILVSAIASFHTNNDDKDADTLLTVTVESGNNQFAKADNILHLFGDHTDNGPFGLSVQGRIPKSALQGGQHNCEV
jgi:hypothetical protein